MIQAAKRLNYCLKIMMIQIRCMFVFLGSVLILRCNKVRQLF